MGGRPGGGGQPVASAPPSATSEPTSEPTPEPTPTPLPGLVNADGTVGPIVALGDSLTAGAQPPSDIPITAPPDIPSPRSWYTQALAVEPRLVGTFNAGTPGDLTAGMVARFDRDVAARTPRVVVILGGTNDLYSGMAPSVPLGLLRALVERTRSIGAFPVLGTVVDFRAVLADEDGEWLPGYTYDGIHPTEPAALVMGRLVAGTLLRD